MNNLTPPHGLRATKPVRRLVAALMGVLVATAAVAGQAADPRTEFIDALARFSLALDGSTGDEGPIIQSSLDAMRAALERWDATIRMYESAMAAEIGAADPPLAARMHLALGGVYLDRGRIGDARRELEEARRIDPNRADVHTLLGVATKAGDSAAAAEAFRRAAALDPANPIRAYTLAHHVATRGNDEPRDGAFRQFIGSDALRAAVNARTPIATPFVRIGLVPEQAGIEPFFPPARYAAGFNRLQNGDYAGALAAFAGSAASDALVVDTGPHRVAIRQAASATRDGAIETAIGGLTRAIGLAPDRAEPYRLLGMAYALDEQYEPALETLQQAVRIDARDERARLALANAFLGAERFDEAEAVLRDTLAVIPSGRARYALARLYQRQGKYADALREFEAALPFEPLLGLNSIYETMGTLHAARQEFDLASAAYSARVDVHPNHPDAHYDLGDIYLRQGRNDAALAEFSIALLLDPSHAKAATSLAQVHLRESRYAEAAEAAARAVDTDPEQHEARYVLATALMRLGRTEEGTRELEVFQRQQAEAAAALARAHQVEALRRDATVSAADGLHDDAVARLRRVLELEPSNTSHLELGLALLDANQPAEAIEHFNAAAKLEAPYVVHRYLATAYASLGRVADAERERASYERIRREALRRRGRP